MKAMTYRQRGFSLMELLTVAGIVMVIVALSIPQFVTMATGMKARGAMSQASGLFQDCRSVAVRFNRIETLTIGTTGSGDTQLKLQRAFNPDPADTTNRTLILPSKMAQSLSPPVELPLNTIWNATNADAWPADTPLSFNARGLPCMYSNGTCDTGGGNKGFTYYFTYASGGDTTWLAVSISPAGRIKSWYLKDSGEWGD